MLTRTVLTAIMGRRRVEAVELTGLDTGATRRLECDTVVFTGDWFPDHELARRGGLVIDAGTRAPSVDAGYRTSAPGVFAAGNLLHGAETAGCARRRVGGGGDPRLAARRRTDVAGRRRRPGRVCTAVALGLPERRRPGWSSPMAASSCAAVPSPGGPAPPSTKGAERFGPGGCAAPSPPCRSTCGRAGSTASIPTAAPYTSRSKPSLI